MNTTVKNFPIAWFMYGKFTTIVLVALFFMVMCRDAKADTFQTVWTVEYKIFDGQPMIAPLPEGGVAMEGNHCQISEVLLSETEPGEYRAMRCGFSKEFDVVVSCPLSGQQEFLSAPGGSAYIYTLNPKTLEKDYVFVALRCQVFSIPTPEKKRA